MRTYTTLAALLGLAGCASQMTTQDKVTFQGALDAGDYAGAAALASAAGQITPDGKSQNVVWSLNAGAAKFDAGDTHGALAVLDNTEILAQANDLNTTHAAIDYHYTAYDGVMTNLYKAMAYLKNGDRDNARVEFNRAEERQRRAEEHFQKEIKAAAEQHSAAGNPDFNNVFQKAEQSHEYQDASNNLSALAVYAPFENPFATYLAGLFFINEGDYEKGIYRLKRASQVLGAASPAAEDLKWAEQAHHKHHGAAGAAAPQTWVVFENGQSATYHEIRIVLPMITGQPMTLALPVLAQNAPALPSLNVKGAGIDAATMQAGSFDAVMASEFRRRQPIIIGEAVAEVVLKNVGSQVAAKSNNVFLKLATAVVANVSTADTRSWTALPKEFQVARVAAPADGKITLTGPDGQEVGEATVPATGASVVWVKMQALGAKPAIQVFPL